MLLKLAKTDMTAQAINLKYNDLNKVLLAEIKRAEKKWQGARGLKKCDSTSEEDAKHNMTIVDEIVDSPNVTRLYGVYNIGDHGVFIINRAKAKLLLGRKLSQQRKPSAYKRKSIEGDVQDDEPSDAEKKRLACMEENNLTEPFKSIEGDVREDELSDYEKKRLARMEENNLTMLNSDIVPQSMGILSALFYLKVKKLSQVNMVRLRKEVTKLGMKFPKDAMPPKEQLAFLLGKELLESGKLKRKDASKVISRDNLVLNV